MARVAFLACTLAILLPLASADSCSSKDYCGCSKYGPTAVQKIVGGVAASGQDWNWMVSLQDRDKHECGAILISLEYAITAAHCVDDVLNNPSRLSILAGTKYLKGPLASNGQRRTIRSIYMHPNFKTNTLENDIAILHFDALSVSAGSLIGSICLPAANRDPFEINSELVAFGWGVTKAGSKDVSNYLQQVTLNVFSSTSIACRNSLIADPAIQFCAAVNGGGKGRSSSLYCMDRDMSSCDQIRVRAIVAVPSSLV